MSTEPTGGSEDGKAVALRATDAGTDARLTETSAPAYADVSDGQAQRKPVIPAHWRTRDAARQHVALAAARHGHAAAYHGVRAPRYLLLAVWWALVGVVRTTGRLLAWWHVPDLSRLESQAAADGLLSDHLRIHRQGRETRKARGVILAIGAAAAVVAVAALSRAAAWAWVLLALVGLPLLARAGARPTGRSSPWPCSRPRSRHRTRT